jgi:hypothetical protein
MSGSTSQAAIPSKTRRPSSRRLNRDAVAVALRDEDAAVQDDEAVGVALVENLPHSQHRAVAVVEDDVVETDRAHLERGAGPVPRPDVSGRPRP